MRGKEISQRRRPSEWNAVEEWDDGGAGKGEWRLAQFTFICHSDSTWGKSAGAFALSHWLIVALSPKWSKEN